jgi:hypothetical protein
MPRTPQPLHIFRKDVLHLWPETAVVVLLFAAFVWAAPSHWSGSEYAGLIGVLAFFLKAFLMPISWLVVISRLIQDESLVGDRQFWTSRPYHWPSLIAAKILYLLVFLYLPFLLMQIFLLKHAGLYPTTAIPALLHNLLLLTVIVVVPIAAISAVTSTFPRALLAFIGTIVYLIVIAALIVWMVFTRMPPPGLDDVATYLFVLLPFGALVFQYATRRTAISRAILIATPAVIGLLFLIPGASLIEHYYPASSKPKLGQLPDEFAPKSPREGTLAVLRGRVLLGLPVTIAGGDEEAHYAIEGIDTSVAALGVHYTSGFKTPSESTSLSAGIPFSIVPVVLPIYVFNNTGHAPADVHLALAVHQLTVDKPSTWKATAQPFSVPGNGVCSFSNDNPDAAPTCVYPFKQPQFSAVSAPLSASCGDPNAPKTVEEADLSGKINLLDFDPVVSTPMNFQSRQQQPGSSYVLCPGTPLTFLGAHDAGKSRLDVDLKQLILANYATHFAERAPRGTTPPPEQ